MTLKCDCGGTLHAGIAPSFDFTPLAGLPVVCERVPCLRCDKCGYETLNGGVIDAIFAALTRTVLRRRSKLQPAEITYLRKELRCSREELAKQLETSETTLAAWELGQSEISSDADARLRNLVNSDVRIDIATEEAEHSTEVRVTPETRKRHVSGRPSSFVIPGDHLLSHAECSAQ